MFATMEAWKCFSRVVRVERLWPGKDAAEVRGGAQESDKDSEHGQQFSSATEITGLRVQHRRQFFALWQVIGCVSAYDAFLAMKNRHELVGPLGMEENWLGQWLLSLDGDDPALFLGVKFLGTVMVLGILTNLYVSRPYWGLAVARGVAAFQMILLAYLTWW